MCGYAFKGGKKMLAQMPKNLSSFGSEHHVLSEMVINVQVPLGRGVKQVFTTQGGGGGQICSHLTLSLCSC